MKNKKNLDLTKIISVAESTSKKDFAENGITMFEIKQHLRFDEHLDENVSEYYIFYFKNEKFANVESFEEVSD